MQRGCCTCVSNRLYLDGRQGSARDGDLDPPLSHRRPHRVKYLEMLYDYILRQEGVVMWTSGEILDWYRTQIA